MKSLNVQMFCSPMEKKTRIVMRVKMTNINIYHVVLQNGVTLNK